mmetsp:Transcript_45532/g.114152  ORF Transcript_45532/g.114152 Transcript_45532/m.114152 type:complete len:232 (-) Transcript_45532:1638-2333(-)
MHNLVPAGRVVANTAVPRCRVARLLNHHSRRVQAGEVGDGLRKSRNVGAALEVQTRDADGGREHLPEVGRAAVGARRRRGAQVAREGGVVAVVDVLVRLALGALLVLDRRVAQLVPHGAPAEVHEASAEVFHPHGPKRVEAVLGPQGLAVALGPQRARHAPLRLPHHPAQNVLGEAAPLHGVAVLVIGTCGAGGAPRDTRRVSSGAADQCILPGGCNLPGPNHTTAVDIGG